MYVYKINLTEIFDFNKTKQIYDYNNRLVRI